MLRKKIIRIVDNALDACRQEGIIPEHVVVKPSIEIPREEGHGDYSTNIAFLIAPVLKKSPGDAARIIIDHIHGNDICERVELAGKGFINFYLKDELWRNLLKDVCNDDMRTLYPDVGNRKKVIIEFVSANPTGPLHIGHGRGAVVGDVLANILKSSGYQVTKEYYINDAGRQIKTLGESTYLRWQELQGETVNYPADCYQGDYVRDLARQIIEQGTEVPADRSEAVALMARYSSGKILAGIQEDLETFGVTFDSYFNESTLFTSGVVDDTLELLRRKGHAYEKDGALWFTTSAFEKDEDRVLVKSGGEKTYFTSDIAYHLDKFNRTFDLIIDIWGSDHHGYIPRLRASIQALGRDKESFKAILIQFVTLLKDGKPVGMSTRSGQFTTLNEVLQEVGKDAARFFFLTRKSDAHLEFDLDLAKKTSNENPVYYVQYAHARISSIFRNALDEGIGPDAIDGANVHLLVLPEEMGLIKSILNFHNVLEGSARSLEPHRITFYLMGLVGQFHSYYNKNRVLGSDRNLTLARLWLLRMTQEVIRRALSILGVSAPEKM